MKAIIQSKYGIKNLYLTEVPKPTPGDNDVLVKISATCVNFANTLMVKGFPVVRLVKGGIFSPKFRIPGSELAGRVECVGKNITLFKPGDEVFGDICRSGYGTFAEYVCANENALVKKPYNLSFQEAAAVPQAAVVALQGLLAGNIRSGTKVLLYGASGGIGTLAIQIAKSFGAEVTGVCSSRNLELVRSLGADCVIDYTSEDFVQMGKLYDLILSIRGYRKLQNYYKALSPEGVYVMAGGSWSQIFEPSFKGTSVFKDGKRRIGKFTYDPSRENFNYIKELIEKGEVKPVVDRCYSLHETPDAFRYFNEGHARGKVVVTID
jgi:NADPH:quinone reductase-like Zn-dependent oxidoreductase